MYILLSAFMDLFDKNPEKYYVFDTDDFSLDIFTSSELKHAFKVVPNLVISGLDYKSDTNKLYFTRYSTECKACKVSDNFIVVTRDCKSNNSIDYYGDITVYTRSNIDKPFEIHTPYDIMCSLDYKFTDLDGRYLAIYADGLNTHYYGEDQEAYVALYIILDFSGKYVRVVRADKKYSLRDDLKDFSYENGILKPEV